MHVRSLLSAGAGALAILAGACTSQVNLPQRLRLDCPVPVPVCAPETATGVSVDTTSVGMSSFMRIARVLGLDTEADEFGVSFQRRKGADALATVRRQDRDQGGATDRIVLVRFAQPDHAVIGDPVPADDLEGPVGGGTQTPFGDSLMVAARRAAVSDGDYDLYAGRYREATIEKPVRSDVSSDGYWDAQPAITPDGNALLFASDRPGGFGGTDLYMALRRPGGGWSEPVNLGPGVNTPCDELSPFVPSSGRWLYFSSSGHATFGGYDLFRAPISRGEIGGAENLGAPINTLGDELFPSAPAGADPDTLLYYSSNQSGSRGFDTYVLHRLLRAGAIASGTASSRPRRGEPAKLSGTVRTNEGVPVDSALVTLDPHEGPAKIDSAFTDRGGRYEFDVERGKSYEVIAGSESTLYSREEIRIPSSGGSVVKRDIALPDTVTFRVNFPFNIATDPYEFTLDDRGLPGGERWVEVIDRIADFLKRTPSGRQVEVVGHTDPVGTDQFNLDLGRRRAEFVLRELVARGVPASALSVRTEGERNPLASRPDESEEIYHARLRRVELIRK